MNAGCAHKKGVVEEHMFEDMGSNVKEGQEASGAEEAFLLLSPNSYILSAPIRRSGGFNRSDFLFGIYIYNNNKINKSQHTQSMKMASVCWAHDFTVSDPYVGFLSNSPDFFFPNSELFSLFLWWSHEERL